MSASSGAPAAAAAASTSAASDRHRSRSRSHERSSKHPARRSPSRSRSRSRSRERAQHRDEREREREGDQKKASKRARTRSTSSEADRKRAKKDRKSEKDKDKDHSSSSSNSDRKALEKQLKAAQKALTSGTAGAADATAMLDVAALSKLLAEETAKAAASKDEGGSSKPSKRSKDSKKDRHKKEKKQKKSRRKESSSGSSSDDDSASSESEDDEDASAPAFLADGVTPRLKKSDYFLRATEYRVWLHATHGKHVDDIATKKSHEYFRSFLRQWNSGKLDSKFYKGIDSSSVEAKSLTKHKWAIKMSDQEKMQVERVKDEVDSAMKHSYAEEFQGKQRIPVARPATAASASAAAASSSHQPFPSSSTADRLRAQLDRKRYNTTRAADLEDLVPKSTGREALLEKRREKSAYTRVDKNEGGMEEMRDTDLMGSGGKSEYQQILARKAAATSVQHAEKATKLSDYQAKEKAKMQAMLASIGMAGKYPLQ